jgi:hypothetical protein
MFDDHNIDWTDYDQFKAACRELGRPGEYMVALSRENDPFAIRDGRAEMAKWLADVWHRLNITGTVHVRRIHYIIVPHKSIAFPKGGNYKNTERHWDDLRWAVRDARYLGLIPDDDFEDRRNAVPIVNLTNGARSADVGIPQRSRRFAYAEAGQPRLYGGCGREFWIASADDVLCSRCGRRQTRRKAHNGPHSHHPRSSTPPSADRLEWSGQGCAAP